MSASTPARLLREARARAGLTQRALAARAGVAQSVVARIESGRANPSWTTLTALLDAAGFAMHPALAPVAADGHTAAHERTHYDDDVLRIRALSPSGRLREHANVDRFIRKVQRAAPRGAFTVREELLRVGDFDPERIIATLERHGVAFVLVGGLAAGMHGFPRLTRDADVTPATDDANLGRLAAALRDLHARIHTDAVPGGLDFDCSPAMLRMGVVWNLVTDAGRVDVLFRPSGTEGYEDLARAATSVTLDTTRVFVASLADIVRMKEAANREKDRQDLVTLRRMLRDLDG